MSQRTRIFFAALLLAGLSQSCLATPICRWVDRSGRTQFSEFVPEEYKKVATCTDSQQYELSPEQQRAEDQRMAEERARSLREAAKRAADRAAERAPGIPSPANAVPQRAEKRPVEIVTDATDCVTAWRIYDESVACFGPYRTARGATSVDAFDVCNVIESPEPRCGPKKN